MQKEIMSQEQKTIARAYFGDNEKIELYQKLKCLRSIREHNLVCLPENMIESPAMVEAEMELARLEDEDPNIYKKISSICNKN